MTKTRKKEGETLAQKAAAAAAGADNTPTQLLQDRGISYAVAHNTRGSKEYVPRQHFDDEDHAAEERALRDEIAAEVQTAMLSGIPLYTFPSDTSEELLFNYMSAVGVPGVAVVPTTAGASNEGMAPEGYEQESDYPILTEAVPTGAGLAGFILELPPGMEFSDKKVAIEEAVKNIATMAEQELSKGDMAAFVNYLDTVDERFHHYSFLNTLLMLGQLRAAGVDINDPEFDPRLVMGFKQWQESPFRRYVKKGAHALSIWAPVIKKYPKTDDAGNNILDDSGKPIMESRIAGFRLHSVFHAIDTLPLREKDPNTGQFTGPPLGEPLPERAPRPPWPIAKGDAAALLGRLEHFAKSQGYRVRYYESNEERGYADNAGNIGVARVWKGEPMPTEEQALVLAHELAHHHLEHTTWGVFGIPRNIKELEAETVAATVCFRSDLSPSYHYLASWGRKNVKKNILQSLDRITNTALWLLNGVMGVA